jgi:ABC-type branched-subunit amino acid transport system ATPase component
MRPASRGDLHLQGGDVPEPTDASTDTVDAEKVDTEKADTEEDATEPADAGAAGGTGSPDGVGDPMLRLTGVSKRFGGVVAVDDVSFSVPAGTICGLIGPNGAGKTTLFDIVSGVTAPTSGTVTFAGEDVTGLSASKRARLGMRRTFQRTQVFSWLSVEDNVVAAMEWRGGGGGAVADILGLPGRRKIERKRRERAAEIIEWCGLSSVRGSIAGGLPLAQQRVLELARAVADKPKLLLLDEPTSGLDHDEQARFGELVASLQDEGCAVLLVEHDAGWVMSTCDHVVVLNLGAILTEGPPARIQSDQAVRDAYLG